jgi:hypothetical protein
MLMRTIRHAAACVLLMAGIAAAQGQAVAPLPDAPSARRFAAQRSSALKAMGQYPATLSRAEPPYRPLTSRQKLDHFVRYSYSPYTMFNVLYNAGYAQATGDPADYGGGMEGFGKRVGASLASTEAGSFFGMYLFPVLLHQDPRYFPMRDGHAVRRGWNAASRLLVTRADDGHRTVNSSGLLAIAFNEALKNAYLPEARRGAGDTFVRMLGSAQGVAGSYVLQEFAPDILRFFHRHAPKKLRSLEQKIPAQIITGVPTQDE